MSFGDIVLYANFQLFAIPKQIGISLEECLIAFDIIHALCIIQFGE